MRSSRVVVVSFMALALVVLKDCPSTAADTIRIGYLGPQTGIFAQAGKDMLDGLRLSLDQIGHQAGGRKIELFEEDTEGNSSTAIAKYRKLVSHDKIHVLTGVLLASVGNSLVPLIERDHHADPHHPRRPDQARDCQVAPALQLCREPDHAPAGRLRGEDA